MDAKVMNKETNATNASTPSPALSLSESEAQKWTRLRSEEVAHCRVFQVRRDISVRENEDEGHAFYCIEAPDWVNVIPLTADGQVLLIEQYRHGIEEITLEIPGGMVDGEESAHDAVRRELLEETGYTAREIVPLGRTRPNPAIQNNWMHHFLALDVEQKQEAKFDAHEHVTIKLVPLADVPGLIHSGAITHALVVAAFHHFTLAKGQ